MKLPAIAKTVGQRIKQAATARMQVELPRMYFFRYKGFDIPVATKTQLLQQAALRFHRLLIVGENAPDAVKEKLCDLNDYLSQSLPGRPYTFVWFVQHDDGSGFISCKHWTRNPLNSSMVFTIEFDCVQRALTSTDAAAIITPMIKEGGCNE